MSIAGLRILSMTLALASQASPQEAERERKPKKTSPPREERFFDRSIDFWGTKPAPKPPKGTPPESPEGPPLRESIWAEPVRMADGRFAIYVPPRAVLDFLEDPTALNLKAYLDWKRERAEKMKRALALLEDYRVGEEAGKVDRENVEKEARTDSRAEPKATGPAPVRSAPFWITYFHKKHCPHCDTQDGLLAAWLRDHPEGTLKVLEFGESPDVWTAHQVMGTPSLLFTGEGAKRTLLIQGLARKERLDQALGTLRSEETNKEGGGGEGPDLKNPGSGKGEKR